MINKSNLKKIFSLLAFLAVVGICSYFLFFKEFNAISSEEIAHFNSVYTENLAQKASYSMRVITIPNSNTTEGGDEMTVFFEKNTGATKIIESSYGGETFHLQRNYYFDDINEFVLQEKYERWDRPYSEDSRIKVIEENSLYFFKDIKLVYWEDLERKVANFRPKFNKKQSEILSELESLLYLIGK